MSEPPESKGSPTPAPWRWNYDCLRGGPLDRPIVERDYDRDRDMKLVVSDADADLIAKAPELAQMLRERVGWWRLPGVRRGAIYGPRWRRAC